jgi:general secretion pathway protein D
MKKVMILFTILFSVFAFAQEKLKMNFKNEEITTVIEHYSKATGQKFIIDSTVRGKITLLNSNDVSFEEAFNQISEALAVNGFAIIKNDDTMTIRNARSAQRDNIETYTSLPKAKPQRMASWIINLKHTSAMQVMQELRMMTSSYGEMSVYERNNQIIISDWTSNMQRVGEILKNLDVPQDPSVSKIVSQARKEIDERRKNMKPKMSKEEVQQPAAPTKSDN